MVTTPTTSNDPARKMVLVADDEPAVQLIMSRVLTQFGLVPVLAGEAWQRSMW